MVSQWMTNVPVVLFSIIAGALSDEFGRKPLMLWPVIGDLVGTLLNIINYAFIDTLPLEFFYICNVDAFFGGYAIYFLGVYSYVTTITNPEERAHRLARLDGIDNLATVVGSLLSPVVFKQLGYFGSYSLSWMFSASALAYMLLFAKEPLVRKTELNSNTETSPEKLPKEEQSFVSILKTQSVDTFISATVFLKKAILITIKGIRDMITKERKYILKVVILVQFVCFATYWLTFQYWNLLYLYMLLVFDGFNETDFAHYNVAISFLNTFFLMIVIPIFSGKLQIHDAMMLFIICVCEILSSFITPFVATLWQFYLSQGLGAIGYCKYALVRSLMAQCIEFNEVGKVFSLLTCISSLVPVGGNPLLRQVYNATLDKFPGAIFLLYGSIIVLAAIGNLFIYSMRQEIKKEHIENMGKSNEKKKENILSTSLSEM